MSDSPRGTIGCGTGPDALASELSRYLRAKIDQFSVMMGSKPLPAGDLDDRGLIALDPIGTVADGYAQALAHLRDVNVQLRSEIAERERAERALRENEERFRTLAEFSTSWVFWRNPDGRLLYVSPATEVITGYAPWEFYEDPELPTRIILPGDRARWVDHCHVADAQGNPDSMEFEIVTRNGDCRAILHQCRPVYGEGGEFLGVRGSNRDITARKGMEGALRESEEFLRDIVDNALDLIQVVDTDGRFLRVNRAWCETLGYDEREASGMSVRDVVPKELAAHVAETLARVVAGENVGVVESTFVARDGRQIAVEGHATCKVVDGRPVAVRAIYRDVTAKKRLEGELLKARKLESLGVLAGGIAHDFNNLLAAILGNISLARARAGEQGEVATRLAEAETAALRAKALTGQLVTFARGGAPVRTLASVGDLVKDTAGFAVQGRNVRLECAIPDGLPAVEVDPAQVSQAVHNLVANALESMPAGGVLAVRAGASDGTGVEKGRLAAPHIWFSVEDSGIGIPPGDLEKVFDPFFTTKERATGLGLSVAYSIVRSHQGTITARSEVGRGSTFTICLPLPAKAEAPQAARETAGRAAARVLVMDDEKFIRDVAIGMLECLGFAGESAENGAQAIRMFREAHDAGAPFDVVIMDLIVPGGMGGSDAVRRLRALYPGLKAIVSSGYSNDPVLSDCRSYGFDEAIAKPYRVKELGDVLRRVLGSAS